MAYSFLGQANSGANVATPYQRVVEPSQLGLFLNLEQAELQRVKRYQEHWRFYLGQHWKFTREDGEPLVTLNYTRALVNKAVAWLVGEGMTVKVPDVLKDHTLPVINEVWKYNLVDQLLLTIALMGGVTGDVFILVTYAPPTAQARRVNPHTRGQIRIQLLNSEQVFPMWDPMDTNVLTAVRIETIFHDDSLTAQQSADNAGRQLHTRRFTQTITATQIIEQYQGSEPVVRENPLGEIPLIHIKNDPVPGEYYGLSDLNDLIDLNRELNEKATDISDIINYHAAPVTVVKGAKVRNLERSPRNIWSGLPPEADVFNLQLQGDLGASINYWNSIRTSMLEISGIPEGSLGAQQAISNTSGVALHTQYQPLVEKTNRKKTTYQPGLQDVNYFILRIKETIDPTFKMPTDLCKFCGGRIVEIVQPDGQRRRQCYMIDRQTFDFMKPEDVKIRFIRQYSFGEKIEEKPFKQVKKEFGKVSRSYWDPAPEETADDKVAKEHDEAVSQQRPEFTEDPETGAEVQREPFEPPAPTAKPPKMPASSIEIPPEPEKITLRRVTIDPATGQEKTLSDEVRDVVPTGCERHEYLNPYENEVILNDTVPKDKQIQADLYEKYQNNGWVSKRWVRKNLDEIEDPDQLETEIEDEQADAREDPSEPEMPPGAGGKPGDKKGDELSRTVGPPFGSNLPGGST